MGVKEDRNVISKAHWYAQDVSSYKGFDHNLDWPQTQYDHTKYWLLTGGTVTLGFHFDIDKSRCIHF